MKNLFHLFLSLVLLSLTGCNIDSASNTASATTATDIVDTTAPSVPLNLTATAKSDTRIDLGWSASTDEVDGSGLAGYRIYRDGALLTTVTTTTFSDTGLSANTLYTYTATAFDVADNESSASLPAGATTNSTGGIFSLSGHVDSHLVDHWAGNAVYLFLGNVTPDDRDGDGGDPLEVASVSQSVSGCEWGYHFSGLAAGDYTLAFTASADLDDPAVNDTLVFSKPVQLTIGASNVTQDFAPLPSSIIRVGPGRVYTTVKAAADVAKDGDVIEIDAGTYQDDISVWRQNNITLRGVGGRAHMEAKNLIDYISGNDQANGKGIWVIQGSNVTIENIEFSGASVPDQNGAGIRAESSGDLSICNSVFHDNENGLLGDANGTLLIEHSEFDHNGFGDGYTHNIYVGGANKFILRYSYSHDARIGHNVKTRASENHILYNRIMDEDTGSSSYDIDVPNGGLTYIIGNLIQQGIYSDNQYTIVSYGAEGVKSGRINNLYMINNTLVNDYGSGGFLYINPGSASSPVTALVMNNLFIGNGTTVADSGGVATTTNNLATTDTGLLVDVSNYDYHLTDATGARDAGAVPGKGDGVDLAPELQYVHPRQYQSRPQDGTIDIGAYEYTP